MENILTLAMEHAEEAEVFYIFCSETPVEFEANQLKRVQTKEDENVSLRLVKEGRLGYSSSTKLDEAEALVGRAVDVAQLGARARFEFPPPGEYLDVPVHDPAVEDITVEDMINLGESLITKVREHTPELLCQAKVTKSTIWLHILNSRGGEESYRKSIFAVSLMGTLIHDTDMLFVGDGECSCHPILGSAEVIRSVITQLELAKNRGMVSAGQLPVVFTPLGVGDVLLAPLAMAFNGKAVLNGASPLAGKIGEQVFDPKLCLWDDATIPYCPQSCPFDDECVPVQCTPLIDNGIVANFLYDLQTGGMVGRSSTGNASRSGGGLPAPSVSALVVGEGEVAFEDMVRDMKEGLVVEQLMGAEQGNILGGDFSGNVLLGYKVENGEIVGRVKDTMVSGNIYRFLADLIAIGKEARWVGSSLRTPALYCPALGVVSKE
jgi:PmbA protein